MIYPGPQERFSAPPTSLLVPGDGPRYGGHQRRSCGHGDDDRESVRTCEKAYELEDDRAGHARSLQRDFGEQALDEPDGRPRVLLRLPSRYGLAVNPVRRV